MAHAIEEHRGHVTLLITFSNSKSPIMSTLNKQLNAREKGYFHKGLTPSHITGLAKVITEGNMMAGFKSWTLSGIIYCVQKNKK